MKTIVESLEGNVESIKKIKNIMNAVDEIYPLRKTKDDALTVELGVETCLINEERELIRAYDYDVNYIDFEKNLKFKENG